ncbi:MAG: hypothetical protein JSU92_08010, partial [Deltaproteobacteria bacterium]
TAENGDGVYLTANTADELAEKLREAIDDIIRRAVSFTSPAVPSARVTDIKETNVLTSEDKIYLASFLPTRKGLFEGHLRAYYIDCKGHIVGGENCHPQNCSDCELVVTDENGVVTEVKCSGCELATDSNGNLTDKNNNPFAQPIWDAGEVLRDTPADNRKIYTFVGVDANGDGNLQADEGERVEFKTDNAGVLFPLLAYGTTVADAEKLIEYVRGKDAFDEDEDGNVNEDRKWKLGDIFHSSPVLVGHPNPAGHYFGFTCDCVISSKGSYCYEDISTNPPSAFRHSEEIMLRPRMLVAGANDGMLHCFNVGNAIDYESGEADNPESCYREDLKDIEYIKFDDGTGEEMWAFIPPNLLPKLKDMISGHQYYVDGTPVVADDWIDQDPFTHLNNENMNPERRKKEWRTVVITGEREGGKHYFALDITYPNGDPDDGSYSWPKFLWEFTDPKMGFAWSEALHGGEYGRILLRDGSNNIDRWVAMMGGGLSPRDENDLDLEPNTGNTFFVVDIATGKKIWEYSYNPLAVDDRKYMTYDISSTPTPVIYNFVDPNSVLNDPKDWFIYWVYVGDLGGRMWKLALNQGLDENRLIPGDFDGTNIEVTGWSGEIFFQADTTTASDQPIYFRPSYLAGVDKKLWIYFGTGDRNNPSSLTDSQGRDISSRFYGIMDFGDESDGSRIQPALPFHETNLTDITSPAAFPSNDHTQYNGQGWYIRLAGQEAYDFENHEAEKVMAKSDAFWGRVYFTTYTPPGVIDDLCAPGIGGAARLYVLGYESGAARGSFPGGERSIDTGTGIPSPVIVTAQYVDGEIVLRALVATSSGGVVETEMPGPPKPCGILSWEQEYRE